MPLPPKLVRRLVLAPLVFVLSLAFLGMAPALLLAAAFFDLERPLACSMRPIRTSSTNVPSRRMETAGTVSMASFCRKASANSSQRTSF